MVAPPSINPPPPTDYYSAIPNEVIYKNIVKYSDFLQENVLMQDVKKTSTSLI